MVLHSARNPYSPFKTIPGNISLISNYRFIKVIVGSGAAPGKK